MNDEHIEAPSEHAPRKETLKDGIVGICVREVGSDTAWVSADYTVPVKR